MNYLAMVDRHDYVAYLNFLNDQYGNDITCNFHTRADDTVMHTCLKTQILAMLVHNRISDHVVYMIYPDEYGIVADEHLVNERTHVEPVPPDFSQTQYQCHWRCGDNSLCTRLTHGSRPYPHYCREHGEEYERQYKVLYKKS